MNLFFNDCSLIHTCLILTINVLLTLICLLKGIFYINTVFKNLTISKRETWNALLYTVLKRSLLSFYGIYAAAQRAVRLYNESFEFLSAVRGRKVGNVACLIRQRRQTVLYAFAPSADFRLITSSVCRSTLPLAISYSLSTLPLCRPFPPWRIPAHLRGFFLAMVV